MSPREGEHWDNDGAAGLRFLVEAVKAYVTGTTPKSRHAAQHGSVPLNGGQTGDARVSAR